MKGVRVGDIAEQLRGVTFAKADASATPVTGSVPVLTAGNIQDGQLVLDGLTYVPDAVVRDKQRVRKDDVVICASSGSLSVVGKAARSHGDFDGGFGAFLKVLRPGPAVDPGYFSHFFQTPTYRRRVSSMAAGANINNLKNEHLDDLEIPLPPLPDQRRLAAILDHADALRAKRRQVLAHLGTLTQSIFRELFDSDSGATRDLADVADFFGGASLPVGEPFEAQSDGTLLMKVSDMNAPGNEEHVRATAIWTSGSTACSATVAAGAVILPKRGASIATNKKRIATRRTALDPNLMGVQPKPAFLTSQYLYEWFRAFDLATITNGSTVPQLNKQDLSPLRIPVPSLDLQHELARRLEIVNLQRASVETASASYDELFASLQTRAFWGDL